jgi:hypothetical protein
VRGQHAVTSRTLRSPGTTTAAEATEATPNSKGLTPQLSRRRHGSMILATYRSGGRLERLVRPRRYGRRGQAASGDEPPARPAPAGRSESPSTPRPVQTATKHAGRARAARSLGERGSGRQVARSSNAADPARRNSPAPDVPCAGSADSPDELSEAHEQQRPPKRPKQHPTAKA